MKDLFFLGGISRTRTYGRTALRAVWSINEGATGAFAPTIVEVIDPTLTISTNRKRTIPFGRPFFCWWD